MANFTPQEIEEMLQEFFDVVGKRQYVGARYVPIFGRKGEDTIEWDKLAPYEPLTVVMHQGVSYVSKQYVPKDVEITDTNYWAETYRFNAQVEQYRQEVLQFQSQIDQIREDMESDYVPFPDSATYPKYGLLGQVLTTLSNGETKWENPVVPSDEQAEEVITSWLDQHPEATTTVQDGAVTDSKLAQTHGNLLSSSLKTFTTYITDTYVTAHPELNDLDNYPINNIYLFSSVSSSSVAHLPHGNFSGYVFTLNYQGTVPQSTYPAVNRQFSYQIAVNTTANDARIYVRSKFSAWTSWHPIMFSDDAISGSSLVNGTVTDEKLSQNNAALLSSALKTFPTYINSAYVTAHPELDDADNYPVNNCYLFSSITSNQVANLPVYPCVGYLLTLNYEGTVPSGNNPSVNREFTYQLFMATDNNKQSLYVRSKFASWTNWKRLAYADELPPQIYKNTGAHNGLKDFTVLGDSISMSIAFPRMGTPITVESWAKIMAYEMNSDCDVYAAGGRSTGDMLADSTYSTAIANAGGNQFAIVCLGVNDINQGVTEATFITNYTTIVTDLLTNHDFVLCATIPEVFKLSQPTEREAFNTDIKTICNNTTGAFVVDIAALNDEFSDFAYLGHMSSVGYATLAHYMGLAIDDCMSKSFFFTHAEVDE